MRRRARMRRWLLVAQFAQLRLLGVGQHVLDANEQPQVSLLGLELEGHNLVGLRQDSGFVGARRREQVGRPRWFDRRRDSFSLTPTLSDSRKAAMLRR